MRRNVKTIAAPNQSDTAITLALVLGLLGVLAAIGSTGWAATSTLFILAAVAGITGLVTRTATSEPRKVNKSGETAATKSQVAELVRPQGAARSSAATPGVGFNVNQFYRYPMNRVAAIFDDLAGVRQHCPNWIRQVSTRLDSVSSAGGRSPSA